MSVNRAPHVPRGSSRHGQFADGTEALGIDLSRPLDEATFAWIGRVFAEHPVLVFRDQNLGAAELAAFGRWFGSPRMHALVKYRHA
jgi:alpha-ketoglutarate-dependent taurine dioxygenase